MITRYRNKISLASQEALLEQKFSMFIVEVKSDLIKNDKLTPRTLIAQMNKFYKEYDDICVIDFCFVNLEKITEKFIDFLKQQKKEISITDNDTYLIQDIRSLLCSKIYEHKYNQSRLGNLGGFANFNVSLAYSIIDSNKKLIAGSYQSVNGSRKNVANRQTKDNKKELAKMLNDYKNDKLSEKQSIDIILKFLEETELEKMPQEQVANIISDTSRYAFNQIAKNQIKTPTQNNWKQLQ